MCYSLWYNAQTMLPANGQLQQLIFFIVAPCILVYVQFTHQQMHFFILKNTLKFTLKYK